MTLMRSGICTPSCCAWMSPTRRRPGGRTSRGCVSAPKRWTAVASSRFTSAVPGPTSRSAYCARHAGWARASAPAGDGKLSPTCRRRRSSRPPKTAWPRGPWQRRAPFSCSAARRSRVCGCVSRAAAWLTSRRMPEPTPFALGSRSTPGRRDWARWHCGRRHLADRTDRHGGQRHPLR